MSTALTLLAGAFLLLAGTGIGFPLGRHGQRVEYRDPPPQPPKAICGCRHDLSMHDPKTSTCFELVGINEYNERARQNVTRKQQCKCRQYVGPRPISNYFSTPILMDEEATD